MAATVDNRPTNSLPVWTDVGKGFVLNSVTVDFSVAANNLAQNETMAIYDLPADHVVEYAYLNITTADTDVTDVDLGLSATGATNASLIDGATLAATGYVTNATYLPIATGSAATQVVFTNKDADTLNEAVIEFIVVARKIS